MTEVLPGFHLVEPTSIGEAIAALSSMPGALLYAGGTDLIVKLRKGLADAETVISLNRINVLKEIEETDAGLRIGAAVTLSQIEDLPAITGDFFAVAKAARSIASPSHRQVATLGGNLCLDTRCVYYNQSHWWRKSNGFCLKYRGDICHVAPQGDRCRAAYSGDMAPALMVHGAMIEIAGPAGLRKISLTDFYHEDGAAHIKLESGDILVAVHLPYSQAVSDYEKVRVRGSIDFPLAGVAVACEKTADGAARFTVAVTGTNSKPLLIEMPGELLDEPSSEAFWVGLGKAVQKAVSPQRTTTIAPHFRRLSVSALAVRLARRLI